MRVRAALTAVPVAAGFVLAAGILMPSAAETRTSALVVRVNVVRSCSVDTRGGGAAAGAVVLTCSRSGTEPGVVSTISGDRPVTRVIPIPDRQTTVIASRPTLMAALSASTAATTRTAAHQLVTVNF